MHPPCHAPFSHKKGSDNLPSILTYDFVQLYKPHIIQWRRKVPKSVCVCGGGGTQTRNLCTFGKEPI